MTKWVLDRPRLQRPVKIASFCHDKNKDGYLVFLNPTLFLSMPAQLYCSSFSTCSVWPDGANTIYRAFAGGESGLHKRCFALNLRERRGRMLSYCKVLSLSALWPSPLPLCSVSPDSTNTIYSAFWGKGRTYGLMQYANKSVFLTTFPSSLLWFAW